MSEQGNKDQLLGLFEAFNRQDFRSVEEILTDDFKFNAPTLAGCATSGDPVAFEQRFRVISAALGDLTYTVEDVVADGDSLAAIYTFSGIHRGEFGGLSPTNRQVDIKGLIFAHFADGKIRATWDGYADAVERLGGIEAFMSYSAPGPRLEPTMTREQVRDLARHLFDGFTRQQLGVFDELCTADLVIDTPEVTIERCKNDGLQASKDLMTKLYSFLPDGVFTMEDLIAEETKVAVRYSFVGTFTDRDTGKAVGIRHANAQCFMQLTGDRISYMRFAGWPEFGGWLRIH